MTFSRRKFFGLLGGVVAAKVAAPIYVLAPPCGWNHTASGLFAPARYNLLGWKNKTAEEIIADVDAMMRNPGRIAFAHDFTIGELYEFKFRDRSHLFPAEGV